MHRNVSMFGCVLLVGCSVLSEQRFNHAMSLYQAEDYPRCTVEPLKPENALSRTECINSALIGRMSAINFRFLPELMQALNYNKQLAIAYSENKMSQGEYEVAVEKNMIDLDLRLRNQVQAENYQRSQAWANAAQTFQQQQSQIPVYRAPQQTSCHRIGNNLNCTTW